MLEMPFSEGVSGLMVTDCLRNYVMEYHVDGFILNPYNVPMDIILKINSFRSPDFKTPDEFQNVMRRFLKVTERGCNGCDVSDKKRWDLERYL